MKKEIILLCLLIIFIGGCQRNIQNSKSSSCGDNVCQLLEKRQGTCPSDCKQTTQPADQESSDTQSIGAGEYTFSLNYDNLKREYLVYVPSSYNSSKPTALIINLHGATGNGAQQCRDSKMKESSEKNGFIVVCPTGSGKTVLKFWNDGYAVNNGIDDEGFLMKMVEDLKSKFNINKKMIYSTGLSNGGIMSYKLACDKSEIIAAIAPVEGSMSGLIPNCNPSRKVPAIIFHGLEDKNVPYEGGSGEGLSGYEHPSVQDALNFWISNNGLSDNLTDSGRIGQARYEQYGEDSQPQVVLWTLEDGGHTWPGGSPLLGDRLGNVNMEISANEEMWKFFQKHTLE